MWTYSQSSGWLTSPAGVSIAQGYSGSGADKNQPEDQEIKDMGPIPEGRYTIGEPEDTDDHGPYVLRLYPSQLNRMFGRDGFLMHGDSIHEPGTASHGCIVMPHDARVEVWESGDRNLQVIS